MTVLEVKFEMKKIIIPKFEVVKRPLLCGVTCARGVITVFTDKSMHKV